MRPQEYPGEWLLTAVGCLGAVLIAFGSALNFGATSMVLPVLGLPVLGGVVLIVGSLLMIGALLADRRLSNRKTREQIIRDTLGAEGEDR